MNGASRAQTSAREGWLLTSEVELLATQQGKRQEQCLYCGFSP